MSAVPDRQTVPLLSLEALVPCWSGLVLWVGPRPSFQRMFNVPPLIATLSAAEREQFRRLLARIIAARCDGPLADAAPCA